MKLLLDENLSVRLVSALADTYPGITHVHHEGLGGAPDKDVWDYAKQGGFTIVSKDSDFAERSILETDPPKIIWIRLGNCSTTDIERLMRFASLIIRRFVEDDSETCLMLGRS